MKNENLMKHLNLTNLAVLVCLVRVSLVSVVSVPDAIIFIAAIVGLAAKRADDFKLNRNETDLINLSEAFKLNSEIFADQIKTLNDSVRNQEKTIEEAKQMMNAVKLGNLNPNRKQHQL